MLDSTNKNIPNLVGIFDSEPRELPPSLPPAPMMDEDMARLLLPRPIADWAIDVSERLSVPTESLAVLAIGALGGIVGRQIAIKPKQNDDWYEFPKTWAVIIAPPSEKKSAQLSEALGPIASLEQIERERFEAKRPEHQARKASLAAQIDAQKQEIKEAGRAEHTERLHRAQNNLLELEKQNACEQLYERRFRTNDATIEKLGELNRQNPNGLIIERDELSGWFSGLDRMDRQQDRAFFLEAWSGKSSFKVDRMGRPSVDVPALSLSVIGTIQPDRLSTLVREVSQGLNGGDGLLQRFQLMVQPDRLEYNGVVDRKPNQEARSAYGRLFTGLAELQPRAFGAGTSTSSETGGVPLVSFDKQGQELFYQWLDEHERKLRSGAIESAALETHLGKYSGLFPRLALLFHLVDVCSGHSRSDAVDVSSAKRAKEWCGFLEAHAKRVYSLGEHHMYLGAKGLLQKIWSGSLKSGCTIRDIQRRGWSHLTENYEVREAVTLLQEYGWIREFEVDTRGKPRRELRFHPRLVAQTQ
jgi:hypothetical protein